MFLTFFNFFFKYIFNAKTRQKLLLMAMSGLVLSSFSLLVVQSALKGLQFNRIERSKQIQGSYVIEVDQSTKHAKLENYLNDQGLNFSKEFELEGIVRNGPHIAPAIIHGLSSNAYIPDFLQESLRKDELLFSYILADKIQANIGDDVQIISPVHTDAFFGDLPRTKTLSLYRFVDTREPEVDEVHAWVNIRSVQSLAKRRSYNKIRIYSDISVEQIKTLKNFDIGFSTWEQNNSTLVYALSLENNMVVFLFMATIVLVMFTIMSGLSIFYARIKQDFASFWILGLSLSTLKKMAALNISLLTVISLCVGNILALGFLGLLKSYSPVIMPDMFVDRSLPIVITSSSFFFSLIIPIGMTLFFVFLSNRKFFSNKNDFLQLIRSVGR